MSDPVRPHRRQPTGLPRPWDSPGKNTGVGCHFLLQCMKVKSESEVAQSCPTLSDPMDCNPPGSSIHGIFQARVLEWGAIAFSANAGYTGSIRGLGRLHMPCSNHACAQLLSLCSRAHALQREAPQREAQPPPLEKTWKQRPHAARIQQHVLSAVFSRRLEPQRPCRPPSARPSPKPRMGGCGSGVGPTARSSCLWAATVL